VRIDLPSLLLFFLQTFQYDERMGEGNIYLVSDYSIQKSDEEHQWWRVYAMVMALLYCGGIPMAAWIALRSRKAGILKLGQIAASITDIENSEQRQKTASKDLRGVPVSVVAGANPRFSNASNSRMRKVTLKAVAMSTKEADPLLDGLTPLFKGAKF
jgi:hypothetical protein